ncbi:hypothetical protein J4772_01535 [Cohnella sp. LGH]|uniref:hypothetical protein n=1 Tax=Cohnella sp. LGH TaxID=1619153 RepID=UPI001AD97F01|nr:hypothetical protein [Cohnella sp. LGH]QTH43182.1 hypothetical protein J4772_01535 [Cohnella sp. LGH]
MNLCITDIVNSSNVISMLIFVASGNEILHLLQLLFRELPRAKYLLKQPKIVFPVAMMQVNGPALAVVVLLIA